MSAVIDASSPARVSVFAGSGTNLDTASFTAPANSLLVACIEHDGDTANRGVLTLTLSLTTGSALTWTQRVARTWAEAGVAGGGSTYIYTAPAVTSEARVVRLMSAWTVGGGNNTRRSMKVYVIPGADLAGTPVDTVGANNEGSSTSANLTTSSLTPGATGLLIAAACDWSQLGVFTSSDLTINTADYAGQVSVVDGYKAVTSGVAATANLNPAGSGASGLTWCQIIVREAPTGGSSYTLTADAGSFAQTGTAATLRASRKLVAGAGTYTQTGTAATLRASRTLAATAGTFAQLGTPATLRASRTLAAGAGTYTQTGTAAALRAARLLQAGAGSYAQTGSDAALTYSPVSPTYALQAEPGLYAQTGTAAALRVARRLAAAAGTYTQAGANATLRASRRLAAGSGSFAQTGTDADLRYESVTPSYTLTAAPGSFVQTGSAAVLRAARRLSASPGTFALTGSAAGLRRGRVLAAASGSFTQTGSAALLRAARRLLAGAGTYQQVGSDAALVWGGAPVYPAEPAYIVQVRPEVTHIYVTPERSSASEE